MMSSHRWCFWRSRQKYIPFKLAAKLRYQPLWCASVSVCKAPSFVKAYESFKLSIRELLIGQHNHWEAEILMMRDFLSNGTLRLYDTIADAWELGLGHFLTYNDLRSVIRSMWGDGGIKTPRCDSSHTYLPMGRRGRALPTYRISMTLYTDLRAVRVLWECTLERDLAYRKWDKICNTIR